MTHGPLLRVAYARCASFCDQQFVASWGKGAPILQRQAEPFGANLRMVPCAGTCAAFAIGACSLAYVSKYNECPCFLLVLLVLLASYSYPMDSPWLVTTICVKMSLVNPPAPNPMIHSCPPTHPGYAFVATRNRSPHPMDRSLKYIWTLLMILRDDAFLLTAGVDSDSVLVAVFMEDDDARVAECRRVLRDSFLGGHDSCGGALVLLLFRPTLLTMSSKEKFLIHSFLGSFLWLPLCLPC
jgi:hypothetical protein